MFDFDKAKVYSAFQRAKLNAILDDPHPGHSDREYFAGFLHHAGYSIDEICATIDEGRAWKDYIPGYTRYQVETVIASAGRQTTNKHTTTKSPRSPKDCIKTADELIDYFMRNTQPVPKLNVPSNILHAVGFYYELGFTPLPKHEPFIDREGKLAGKYPSIDWIPYQTQRPTYEEMTAWDWSYGICLLANDEYSFLDIDRPGYEAIFHNRHLETTPRRGLHVYGKGTLPSVNEKGIGEVKGKGTLIVAYPTEGYRI